MTDTEQSTNTVVTIYSTPWCAFCKTEKQYLEHLGVAYVEKDVENDAAAMEELRSKNGGSFSGVPVTDIAGDIVLGFDRAKIDATLRQHELIK